MSTLESLFVLYCGSDQPEPTAEELEAQRKYMEQQKELEKHTIFSWYQFSHLCRAEADGGGQGVKVVRDKTGLLHFMDTTVWPFHYQFCVSTLGETRTLQEFNGQVYTGKDRSMMFATIVSYPAPENARHYCLELNPADPMTGLDALNGFFEDVKKNFITTGPCIPQLLFHPTSAVQAAAIKDKNLTLPIITSDEIYGAITYKMVQPGVMPNKVVRIFTEKNYSEADLNAWLLQRTIDDIVVIPSVPTDIPVVGGVICGEIIPPLCHVALLCQNRKTPCGYVANAPEVIEKVEFTGSPAVFGLVTKTGFFLDEEEYKYDGAVVDHTKVDVPAPNTSVAQLIDLHADKHHATDIHVVGAKAAQLAKVEEIYDQALFKGTFVIPFHHYHSHVFNAKEIAEGVSKRLTHVDGKPLNFADFAFLQEMIVKQAISDELVKHVIEKIQHSGMTSVIFRSSTNAEDLTGFNGAGLYESVSLKGNDARDPKQVGAAIKKVWASVWSPKSVMEREHYSMAHKDVNMAILVQPFIDDKMTGVKVHYNGVCITHDVVRHKLKHGFFVNCFPGSELRVTNHYKNKTPEQAVLFLGREAGSVDIQLNTMATDLVQPLVTQHDAEKMVQVFGKLHSTMLNRPHKLDDTVALDIEFMVVDNAHSKDTREIVVLQARPYSVNAVDGDLEEKMLDWFSSFKYLSVPITKRVFRCTIDT